MKHLNNFKENIIAYDFDGTLHLTVNKYGHPLDYYMSQNLLKPNWPMINKLKEDAISNKIVVVSARNWGDEEYIQGFLDLYKLPIAGVFCTNDMSKLEILEELGVSKIYDDNLKVKADLEGSDIEFSLPLYNSPQQ